MDGGLTQLIVPILLLRCWIYALSAIILGSLYLDGAVTRGAVPLIAVVCVYPAIVGLVCIRLRLRSTGIRRCQLADAVIVGLLIHTTAFSPLPALAFFTALTISNIALGGVALCVKGMPFMLAGMGAAHLCFGTEFVLVAPLGTTVLCILAVIAYTSALAHRWYRQAALVREKTAETRAKELQLEALTGKLGKYVSPQVYQLLFDDGADVVPGTKRKRLTVFFSDIEGFTELTDHMDPEALAALLNEYLDEMAQIALRFGGTIDKFLGDGIMVFFGDPVSKGPQHDAVACVEMALAMKARMAWLTSKWRAMGVVGGLHVRIGIHSGYCTVGNFGCASRVDYTAIGSSVNLASRIEGVASRDQILVSYATKGLVKARIPCRKHATVALKGIAHPVALYEVCESEAPDRELVFQEAGIRVTVSEGALEPEPAMCLLQDVAAQVERVKHARQASAKSVF